MNLPERTDEELMNQLREGDSAALAELIRIYQNDIFRFCVHYVKDVELAKEMAQETFIRVYVARERFDSSRKFRPWILCIARNLCLNELKRRKTVPMESFEEYVAAAHKNSTEKLSSDAVAPDENLINEERHEMLASAIEQLDEESREIVVLRFFEQLSAHEIADIVGGTEGAVRTRLHRVLKGLREQYAGMKQQL